MCEVQHYMEGLQTAGYFCCIIIELCIKVACIVDAFRRLFANVIVFMSVNSILCSNATASFVYLEFQILKTHERVTMKVIYCDAE